MIFSKLGILTVYTIPLMFVILALTRPNREKYGDMSKEYFLKNEDSWLKINNTFK